MCLDLSDCQVSFSMYFIPLTERTFSEDFLGARARALHGEQSSLCPQGAPGLMREDDSDVSQGDGGSGRGCGNTHTTSSLSPPLSLTYLVKDYLAHTESKVSFQSPYLHDLI